MGTTGAAQTRFHHKKLLQGRDCRSFCGAPLGRHGRGQDAAAIGRKQVCFAASVLDNAQPTTAVAEPAAVHFNSARTMSDTRGIRTRAAARREAAAEEDRGAAGSGPSLEGLMPESPLASVRRLASTRGLASLQLWSVCQGLLVVLTPATMAEAPRGPRASGPT